MTSFVSSLFLLFTHCEKEFHSSKFVLTPLERRGIGLIAVEHICKGDLLIKEKPLLTIRTKQSWFQPSDSYSATKIRKCFATLSEEEQSSYQALSQYPPKQTAELGRDVHEEDLLAIFRSNAYPFNSTSAAVYPVISRINSECKPNVHYHCDNQRYGYVHAIREIEPGEEITNCYIGQLLTRSARQDYLHRHFGFYCDCIVCRKTGDALVADDQLRASIATEIESIRNIADADAVSSSRDNGKAMASLQYFQKMMERVNRQEVRLEALGIADDPVLQLQLHDLALRFIRSFLHRVQSAEFPIATGSIFESGDNGDDNLLLLKVMREEQQKRILAARNAAMLCKGSTLGY